MLNHKYDLFDVKLQTINIAHYHNSQMYLTYKLYFSRDVYSPPSFGPSPKGPDLTVVYSLVSLKREVSQAVHSADSPICSNGTR